MAEWSARAMAHACGTRIADTAAQADHNLVLDVIRSDLGKRFSEPQFLRALKGRLSAQVRKGVWDTLRQSEQVVKIGRWNGKNGKEVDWYGLAGEGQ